MPRALMRDPFEMNDAIARCPLFGERPTAQARGQENDG